MKNLQNYRGCWLENEQLLPCYFGSPNRLCAPHLWGLGVLHLFKRIFITVEMSYTFVIIKRLVPFLVERRFLKTVVFWKVVHPSVLSDGALLFALRPLKRWVGVAGHREHIELRGFCWWNPLDLVQRIVALGYGNVNYRVGMAVVYLNTLFFLNCRETFVDYWCASLYLLDDFPHLYLLRNLLIFPLDL